MFSLRHALQIFVQKYWRESTNDFIYFRLRTVEILDAYPRKLADRKGSTHSWWNQMVNFSGLH